MVRMEEIDKPGLGLLAYEQIELELHAIDKAYWKRLRLQQMPTPNAERAFPHIVADEPRSPQRPALLSMLLDCYAQELFVAEFKNYPTKDRRISHWLVKLSERTEARIIQRIKELESRDPLQSLAYHGISEAQMRQIIRESFRTMIGRAMSAAMPIQAPIPILQIASLPSDSVVLNAVPEKPRLSSTVTSIAAVRKLNEFLAMKGIGLTEFAGHAQTTDRTLRSFRKTGKVRRNIFDNIAKAMGTTKDDLLKD
jgi:hypothetical protein